MIFNLMRFLRDHEPTETYILDGWHDDTTEGVLVTRTGGTDNHYTGRIDHSIQVQSRSRDRNISFRKISSVYKFLRNRFGVNLPDVSIGGFLYEGFIVAAMRPLQVPGYMGIDPGGFHAYSFNILITVDGSIGGDETPIYR